MPNLQQKLRNAANERVEQFKERSVEKARENFSKLPSYLMEQAFGPQPKSEEKQPEYKNYTSFNEAIRGQLGIAFGEQDKPKLDKTRNELAELKRQMDIMRNDEAQARAYLDRKEQERKSAEAAEEEQKQINAAMQQQSAAAGAEPGTKAKRGQEKRKQPDKTMENKASFGKQ